MCLDINNKFTSEYLMKDPDEVIDVYKVVRRENKNLWFSFYKRTPISKGLYKAKGNKRFNDNCLNAIYSNAIHCYYDLSTAILYYNHFLFYEEYKRNICIIKCQASMRDFIAAGCCGDICFSQVEVTGEV